MQFAILNERRDRWLNSENAVCVMHSQCISLSRPVSVDCSFFAFRPLTWQKQEDTIFSFSCRLHAASLCPAFAILRRRFWSRISSRYCCRRETAKKKRIKHAFRFSAWLKSTSVKGESFLIKGYRGPFSSSLSLAVCEKPLHPPSPFGDQKTISIGFYCICLKSWFNDSVALKSF